MMRRIANVATSAAFGGCLILTCSSCAISLRSPEPLASRPAKGTSVPTRLAQLRFGRDAAFAVCEQPACPRVTPKTIATTTAPAIPVVFREPAPANVTRPDSTPAPRAAAVPAAAGALPRKPSEEMSHNVVVTFPFASSELTSATKSAIEASIKYARQADRITISGRTDDIGDVKVNEALALSRALAVRNYFRDVAPDLPATIAIDAKGRCCFVAANTNKEGRSKNRRVEILFASRGGA